MSSGIAVIETHPVQYHAPVYRALQQRYGVPTTAIYGSDFSVAGYRDTGFGATFAWDTDLVSGYSLRFLSRTSSEHPHGKVPQRARGLAKALRESAPAVVLLMGYSPRFYQDAILAAWSARYPLLFRGETTDLGKRRMTPKQVVRDTLLSRLYRRCSALLYIGRHSYAHYRRLGVPEQRLVFSPYCVDASTFRTDEADRDALRNKTRARLGLGDDRRIVLFSGKLIQRKNPALLIEAIKLLPQTLRDQLSVVFLGDGELRARLEEDAALAPMVDCRFAGFQNQRELSQYYHAADVFALPSRYETWGLVVNEALHHGLPCVVSDRVGSAPDLIEPGITGMMFESDSASGLAGALHQTLAQAERPQTRRRCREQVERYSVEQAASGIAEAYHIAISNTRATRP